MSTTGSKRDLEMMEEGGDEDDINEEGNGGEGGEGGDGLQDTEIREQDRFLPIANIARIMKKVLPNNAKIAKDAKESLQECVSEFISFITSEASDKCQAEKRKTINGDDSLWAMNTLGFDKYVDPLKTYLSKYRESVKGEKPEKKLSVSARKERERIEAAAQPKVVQNMQNSSQQMSQNHNIPHNQIHNNSAHNTAHSTMYNNQAVAQGPNGNQMAARPIGMMAAGNSGTGWLLCVVYFIISYRNACYISSVQLAALLAALLISEHQ